MYNNDVVSVYVNKYIFKLIPSIATYMPPKIPLHVNQVSKLIRPIYFENSQQFFFTSQRNNRLLPEQKSNLHIFRLIKWYRRANNSNKNRL